MNIYISGPITGMPDDNAPAFFAAKDEIEKLLEGTEEKQGYYNQVINPILIGMDVKHRFMLIDRVPVWTDYMRACIPELCRCDYIVFLEGWEKSDGANIERYIAEKLGIRIFENIEALREFAHGR